MEFRTALRQGYERGANAGGRFAIIPIWMTGWGARTWIIDTATGKILVEDEVAPCGWRYSIESAYIIENPAEGVCMSAGSPSVWMAKDGRIEKQEPYAFGELRKDPIALSEKLHFRILCPSGTTGFERNGHYICSDSPDGMWIGEVDVVATIFTRAQDAVKANSATLALTDSAYMSVVREVAVDGEPAVIVKQTFGSEAGSKSDIFAQTLLVVHNGYLYSVHAREYQKDTEAFFASFHFTI